MKQFILERNNIYAFKLFDLNGRLGVPISFHNTFKSEFGTTICTEDSCPICKIREYLKENDVYELFLEKSKNHGEKESLNTYTQYIIPAGLYNRKYTNFSHGVLRMWASQALNIANFIYDGKLEKLGDYNDTEVIYYKYIKSNSFKINRVPSNKLMYFMSNMEEFNEFIKELNTLEEDVYNYLNINTNTSEIKTLSLKIKNYTRQLFGKN